MTIPASGGPESVRFTAIDSCGEPVPGVEVRVELQVEGFRGETTAWFSRDDIGEFIASLKQLEKHRKGSALLPPSGPGECQLELATIDNAGHTRVTTEIQRSNYLDEEYRPTRLSGSFELDSEFLVRLIEGMKELSGFHGAAERADATDKAG